MSEEISPPTAAPNTSGQGAASQVPDEIKKWSWGAFLMNWIWGIGNSTWIALLALIPVVNIVMIFVLGAKGNEWAWRNKKWASVEEFKRIQRIWAWVGLGLLIFSLMVNVLLLILGFGVFLATEGIDSGFDGNFDEFDFDTDMDF